MFADFEYYQNTFGGSKIKTADEYKYLGQQASRYILKYTSEVNSNTKDCEGALAEYLQGVSKSAGVSSETIPNAYSVSYATNDYNARMSEINAILELYLGDLYSSVGNVILVGQGKGRRLTLAFCFRSGNGNKNKI